jgi:hypothetical protein
MPLFASAISLVIAAALLMAGVATAWSSANLMRRMMGLAIALIAAVVAASVLGAPDQVAIAATALAFAYLVAGVSVLVRLHETYATSETPDLDAADDADEPAEPRG